jgi:hypothetical protein
MTFHGRQRLRTGLALAERWGCERAQGFANDAEATPRGLPGASVGVFSQGAAQDRQRLRGRLPQHRLLAQSCDVVRKARGLVIVRRRRRPNPLDAEFPFREMSIQGATPSGMNTTRRQSFPFSAPKF